ncbi:MAG: histidine kinase [Cellulophaga sp.]|nr:histidine kinase [Cellulophaga sp.]
MKPTRENLNYFEPLIIIAFWALLFASPLLFGRFESSIDWDHIFKVWVNYLPLLGLFLINRFILLPKLFFKGKKSIYFLSTIVLIVLFATSISFFNEVPKTGNKLPPRLERSRGINPPFEGINRPPPRAIELANRPKPIPQYANFIILAVLLVGFDAGLQISMRWSKLEQEKANFQKESVENQMAFLRNQVSPHFFMNTLNNIHALVDIDSEEAKTAIIKLSKLMRHLLYESEDLLTPIKKEVAFIESYIELMRLRFTDKIKIAVLIPTDIPEKSIPPLLFTSLLENAFKHGISYNQDSFIKIEILITENRLNFQIENSNHAKKTDTPSGIGIENTKKRLDLVYKNEYQLTISETKEIYSVNLNIPI